MTTPRISNRDAVSLSHDGPDAEIVEQLRAALEPRLVFVRRLGAGGMGTVYLARDTALKRLVAIKALSPELARDPVARGRFEREAEAVAAIAHPNVVAVYSVGELPNGTPYFVMQYVSGKSASERLKEDGPFDQAAAKRILGDVASALATAHRQGIIHRDIKPANILLDDQSDRVVVSDFGIAAVLSHEPGADEKFAADALKLTQTGTMVGTPAYMSPEQLLAEPITEKTDIYSLGLLGYELLTGGSAYEVSSPREILAAHLRDRPIKLSAVVPDMDPEFEALLESCLSKDAASRPTAADVATRLTHGASVLLDWPPPGLEPLQGRLVRTTWMLGAGALGLGVPVIVLASSSRSSGWRQLLPSPVLVASAAAVGALLCLAAGLRLVRLAFASASASRAGHGWITIAEVALDRKNDVGALIAGAREYAALSPETRSQFRKDRLIAGLAFLAAALVPIVGFFIGLPIAVRLHASSVLAGLTVGVCAACVLAGGMLNAREGSRLRRPRGRLLKSLQPPDALARLATAWRASFEQVRRGQTLGTGAGARRWPRVAAIVVGAAIVCASIVAYGMTAAAEAGEAAFRAQTWNFASVADKAAVAERMRPFRPPVDSTITPLRAGEALYAIHLFGREASRGGLVRQPTHRVTGNWTPVFKTAIFGTDSQKTWLESAILLAPRGFTPQQRALLRSQADNPMAGEFAILAHAPRADFAEAAWVLPLPDTIGLADTEFPGTVNIKNAAYSEVAHAALDLANGHADSAEARLRGVVSAGFVMLEERTVIENLIGAVLVSIGRSALGRLYEATGRTAEARTIASMTAEARSPMFDNLREMQAFPDRGFGALRKLLRDPKTLAGIRWELVDFALPYLPCSDLHQVLFGPDEEQRAAYTEARPTLVYTAIDSLLFDMGQHALDRPIALPPRVQRPVWYGVTRAIARSADAVLGGHRVEACSSILWWQKLTAN